MQIETHFLPLLWVSSSHMRTNFEEVTVLAIWIFTSAAMSCDSQKPGEGICQKHFAEINVLKTK